MPSYQKGSSESLGDLCALEFVGGPLDGFQYVLPYVAEDLIDTVALPVNQNVIRMLLGKHVAAKLPATSVAIYELRNHHGIRRYWYLGSASVKQCQLEDWIG